MFFDDQRKSGSLRFPLTPPLHIARLSAIGTDLFTDYVDYNRLRLWGLIGEQPPPLIRLNICKAAYMDDQPGDY